ncbi:hypothetical protein B398_07340 [Xylella fastidiosa 32]|nr:hypothetical protein B398_07340 [Xylella fastidiosa 32]
MLALVTALVMAIIINYVDSVGSGVVVRLEQFDWLINSVF